MGQSLETPNSNIINNKQNFRFEMPLPDGEVATLEYRWLKGSMVLMHTLVPKSAQGHGVAATLVKYVLDYIRSHDLKAIIYCPYVTEYLKKHPDYNDIVDPEHPMK